MKLKFFIVIAAFGLFGFVLTVFAEDIVNKLGGTSNTAEFQITDSSSSVLLEVQGDGNVGIGTGTPGEKLEVNGNLNMSGGDIKTDRWLTSDSNTLIGVGVAGAGNLSHSSGSQGWYNTALGYSSLYSITEGYENVALGYQSLYANTTGYQNTAIGHQALLSNSSGFFASLQF